MKKSVSLDAVAWKVNKLLINENKEGRDDYKQNLRAVERFYGEQECWFETEAATIEVGMAY